MQEVLLQGDALVCPGREAPYLQLRSVPVWVHRDMSGDQMAVRIEGDQITQVGRVIEPGLFRLSPAELRERFLAVANFEQAVSFMQICGPFIDRQPGMSTQTVTWPEFKSWQTFTEQRMLGAELHSWPSRVPKRDVPYQGSPYEWFTDPVLYPFTPDGTGTGLTYMADTCLQVIAATIAIDGYWKGISFRKCPECGVIFEAAKFGAHEKRYCSPAHSRKAARARSKGVAAEPAQWEA